MSDFHGRNAPIYVKLNSTGERLRVLPTIDCMGSRYLTVMFPTKNGDRCVLQRVLRENVTFDRGETQRFGNWEIAVRTNHERLVRWATGIFARQERNKKPAATGDETAHIRAATA